MGLNVTVARKNFVSTGLESFSKTYAKFLPNATTDNYLSINNNIGNYINLNWSKGVIFLNNDAKRFNSLSAEKQKASITHEVGHALKLCHSNDNLGVNETYFYPDSIMKKSNSTISNSISLYDKSSLIKKWREMP